jgi:Xaa-Pro dipeptidase
MTWIRDIRPFGTFFITSTDSTEISAWEHRLNEQVQLQHENDPLFVLKKALAEKNLLNKKLGVDEAGFRGEKYQEFLAKTAIDSNGSVVKASDIFRKIRAVKTADELSIIREANLVAEKGMRVSIESIRVGATGKELVQAFSRAVAEQGVISYLPSISTGRGSYLQHNFSPPIKKLERGDLIRFDIICSYKNHFTDNGRNVVLGEATQKQKDCYKVVKAGADSAISKLASGAKASDVFTAGVDGARKAGMTNFRRSHCGHGIGLELYEHPFIVESNNDSIEAGTVLNIETPFYEIANGGYMVEDTLLVTSNGADFITKMDRDLLEIPA